MINQLKAAIFDIDGTLTFTNQLIFDSFNYIAEKYLNKKFSDEKIIALFGPTEDVILKQMFPDKFDEVRKDYYEYYHKNHEIAQLYDGIKELLIEIKKAGMLLGIFTGKGRTSSLITLNFLGIRDLFDMIVTGDDVKNHKPSPEGIIKFIKTFNLKPKEVMMIGDAPSDIKAAREAGVHIASVVWDSYSADEVRKLNKETVFETVNELRKFIFGRGNGK
ncbi:Putative phosphatase [Ignavibacterium album JCM 16511]|uniref:phosphoglycolate phosphatase n=1 Tax=Ignavibacterium album (strain DSM 19864 / JCM 16511 / NBRC 101810 / Mat9-16) TaxID=945713 RepID=I0ALA8_IGNAJ|nr:HAD family hydrolase [Ignavibacterium album]AFH49765.1 Putative phosphatase [Ignavibacterium album JCM 16511]